MAQKYNWNELYEDYLKSGLSKKEFAHRYNIHPTSVYKAFNKMGLETASVRESEKAILTEEPSKRLPPDPPSFIPVSIASDKVSVADNECVAAEQYSFPEHPLVISVGNVDISISDKSQVALLKDVLKAVLAVC